MWHYDKWRPLAGSIFNLAVNIVLVRYIGLYGILISTIAMNVIFSTYWGCSVLYKYYFKKPFRKYIYTASLDLLITAVIALITYEVCSVFSANNAPTFFIRLFICLVLPNILYCLSFIIKWQKSNLQFVVARLLPRRFMP